MGSRLLRENGTQPVDLYELQFKAKQQAEMITSSFWDNLQYIRQVTGYSETVMAKNLHIDLATYSRWQCQKRVPFYAHIYLTIYLWAKQLRQSVNTL